MLRFGRVRATHLPGYWCVPSSGCDCCHGPTLIPVVLLERLMVCVLWLFVVTDQMPLRCNARVCFILDRNKLRAPSHSLYGQCRLYYQV